MTRSRGIWMGAGGLAWMVFSVWTFSLAYSDSFFSYDQWSRVPVLVTAVFGAVAVPASGYLAWRRQPSLLRAVAFHSGGVVIGLAPLALAFLVLSRAPGRWRLEADDAMGAGIDFGILVGLGVISVTVLVVSWGIREAVRRRRPDHRLRG